MDSTPELRVSKGAAVRRFTGAVVTVGLCMLAAGCTSAHHQTGSDAVQTGAGGAAGVAAAPAVVPTTESRLRLGYVGVAADSAALVGLRDDLFRADLGAGVALEPVRFSSGAAAESALAAGHLDAAYLDPVSAVSAWQRTGGGIRVISGAASEDGKSAVVLVVTSRFLATRPKQVQGLLKGQVQTEQLLITEPGPARRLVVAELMSLGVHQSAQRFARLWADLRFSCDPLQASVLAQARYAAASGTLKAVSSLSGVYDLGPVNKLLRAAGYNAVG